jgi:subtilisin family serine protease
MTNDQDVFAELFALLTPDRLLGDPRATGSGVSVCILDSGVDEAVLAARAHERGREILPISGGIFVPDQPEPLPYQGRQSTPHGTTVADIIFTLAPQVRLFSADIFGPRGTSEIDVVLKALHWAVDVWNCKIVNMSLGITEQRLQQLPRRAQLLKAIEDAYFKDVLVIAAAHNEHPLTRSFPAVFAPPLISVDKDLFENPLRLAYHLNEQIEFRAHGRGYLGPFAQEPATSWAAPHLAGIAARILSLRPELKPFEVKTLLYWLGQAQAGLKKNHESQ